MTDPPTSGGAQPTSSAAEPDQARLLSVLADSVPLLVAYVDASLRYRFNNVAYERWYGRPRDEMRGRQVRDVVGEAVYAVIAPHVDAVLRGLAVTFEGELPFPDGARRYVHSTYTPDLADDGTVRGFVAIVADISERRQAERAAIEARCEAERALARVDALLGSSLVGLGFMDKELRYVRVNNALATLNRVPAEEHVGRTVHEVLGDAGRAIEPILRKIVDEGVAMPDIELAADAPEGTRSFLASYFPVRTAGGETLGVGAAIMEITERKRAEDALRARELEHRILAEATAAVTSSLNARESLQMLAGLIVPALADGCAIEAQDGDRLEDAILAFSDPERLELAQRLRRAHPPDRSAERGAGCVLRCGEPAVYTAIDAEMLRASAKNAGHLDDLQRLGILSAVVVPMIAGGKTLGTISLYSTTPARRYTEAALPLAQEIAARAALAVSHARLYRKAQDAARAREDLLAMVSHDLKNPLGTIRTGAAIALAIAPGDPRLEKALRAIERSVAQMDRLAADLLDVATLEAGRLTIRPRAEDLERLLNDAVEGNEAAARAKGQTVFRSFTSVAGIAIECDRQRILQVFGNLLGNAIKFSPPGATITVSAEPQGDFLRLAVADDGPGIPESERMRIFEPYWSAERHGKKGTGLGLYISQGIVEAHGGRLWAESSPSGGATLVFVLPVARAGDRDPSGVAGNGDR
jgi:PAS domain S-box-containing protein